MYKHGLIWLSFEIFHPIDCFPVESSSSMPAQTPCLNSVGPRKRRVPVLPSSKDTRSPTENIYIMSKMTQSTLREARRVDTSEAGMFAANRRIRRPISEPVSH
jgi:hypothetical protein